MRIIDLNEAEAKINFSFKELFYIRLFQARGKAHLLIDEVEKITSENSMAVLNKGWVEVSERAIERLMFLIGSNTITSLEYIGDSINLKVSEVVENEIDKVTIEEIDTLFSNYVIALILSGIREEFKNKTEYIPAPAPAPPGGKKYNQMAIHLVSQFYGDNKQLSLFSSDKVDLLIKGTGIPITNRPESYGVVLNQSQKRVFEGILRAFSNTNYKGVEEIDKQTYSQDIYPVGKLGGAYNNIDKIPVVRLTQAEIIELSGYDLKSQRQGDKQDVVEAITFLATQQFCFYWLRTKKVNNKIAKDKNGSYLKEEVMEVGTLFRIKYVRNQTGELQYYEIHPSAPLLDQVNNYFLLVPNNWREEVKQITGKRASSYTYEFLLWLRLQYEQIRRYNQNNKKRVAKEFFIIKTWEEVAIALKMPPTMYKANRKRASKIIQEAYSVAITLGYLLKVDNNGSTDTLFLNEGYYPKPGELK